MTIVFCLTAIFPVNKPRGGPCRAHVYLTTESVMNLKLF